MSKTSNILIFRGFWDMENSSTLRVTVFRFFVSIRLCFALQRWSIVSLSEFKSYYSFWREKWKYNQLLLSTFLFFNHGQDRNQKIAESIRTNPNESQLCLNCSWSLQSVLVVSDNKTTLPTVTDQVSYISSLSQLS